jgi:hypothetical protein
VGALSLAVDDESAEPANAARGEKVELSSFFERFRGA